MPTKQTRNTTDPNELPNVHQQTRLALEYITDHAAFQELCDAVLSEYWRYRIHPRGVSAHGTVRGQPDSWGEDREGRVTAFCYGSDQNWRRKLWKDLNDVAALQPGFSPEVVVFCTNRHIDPDVERQVVGDVRERYAWELRLFEQGELAVALDTELQHIRAQYLHIKVERHTWQSLLAACADQRRRVLARYTEKYDPTLYVPRRGEAIVEDWYRGAIEEIAKGKPQAQVLPLVDQAGAGKSNLMLHLAAVYGARGPVLVLSGSLKLSDEHGFERELVEAVGYPLDRRTYRGDLGALCEVAQRAGYPLLVIIDAVNEGRDLALARSALIQLLTAYRDHPLLILMTCRDSVWPHLSDPALRSFVPPCVPTAGHSPEFGVALGLYDDDEYRAAQERYFARSEITGHLSGAAAQVLRLPLLLRIFAEVFRGRNLGHMRAPTSADLWREYAARKVVDVHEALNRSLRPPVIDAAIQQVARMMLERGTPVLELAEVAGIPHLDPDSQSADSLLIQLQNTGILLEDPPETLRFTHEPFAEFVLGRILAGQLDRAEECVAALGQAEQLVRGERWRHVVVHAATLVADPEPLLARLRAANLWWAARALLAVGGQAPSSARAEIVRDLVSQLASRYALDRRRAADALGRLGASESVDPLRAYWTSSHDTAALRALARLGVEDIAEAFVLYLGGGPRFLWPELQALVDSLTDSFKGSAVREAIRLLGERDHAEEAAAALRYLRDSQAIGSLMTYLEAAGWTDAAAFMALLRIGTPEALTALERAIGAAGEAIARTADAKTKGNESASAPGEQEGFHAGHPDAHSAITELRAYGLQHSAPQRVIPLLTRLLKHPNGYVRHEAIMALSWLGEPEVASDLVAAAASQAADGWLIGVELTQAFEAFGPRLNVQPLLDMVNDPATPDGVMPYLVAALGASGDRRAFPALRRLVLERRFLMATIQALGALGDPAAIEVLVPLLEAGDTDGISADRMHDLAVVALGRLQHPAAFDPLERRYRAEPTKIELESLLEALVAAGRERAIPVVREAWHAELTNRWTKRGILQALIWIGTPAAITAVHELLDPLDTAKASILVQALFSGRGLPFITGTVTKGPVDDDIVELVDAWFDLLPQEEQQTAIWALGAVGTPRAMEALKRVAEDPRYDMPMPCAQPGESRTMRNEALGLLAEAGSSAALEFAADSVGEPRAAMLEEWLARMDRPAVLDALCRRLDAAPEAKLVRLLEMLGWLGDQTVLDAVRHHLDDSRQAVADAAYEAEQRILELADW